MSKAKVNTARPRRRPQHSDDKLLDAATAVFAQAGYAAATVDAIAERGGATKPTLYARFGAKADLYRTTVERERDVFLEQLFSAYGEAAGQPVTALIERAVHGWFDYADRRPDGFRLLLAEPHGDVTAGLVEELRATVTDRVTTLIEGAMERLDQHEPVTAGLVAAMIVGACVDGARRLQDDPKLTTERAATVATAFVIGATAGLNRPLLDV
ncbi:MAG TPA: TetR/AcrR family transcriptional regulator [Baekduia sp.]|uniref:TetR/AcrR family transcriptional regulator n=1 Tax=Baekduia sp. TaxID=2600305 RepID=UPI002D78116F|nr:TetR/AcrR family transcriptional regulator [Baekduia sp.]HET6505154.1 TetR/AcrR family transcriptional regulator [Baekduia sp.]